MAYPARNFEKDPSKRTKGWYMVPGKGRRYWDGKAFKYRSPDGTTNVKDMVGDRLKGLVKRISKGSEKGKEINTRRGRRVNRTTTRGRGTAVQSDGSPSTAPNPKPESAQNNPSSSTEKKPQVKKTEPKKTEPKKKTAYQIARDKIKSSKDKKSATLSADIEGLNSFIKAHGKKKGMAKAIAKAKESLKKKRDELRERKTTPPKTIPTTTTT